MAADLTDIFMFASATTDLNLNFRILSIITWRLDGFEKKFVQCIIIDMDFKQISVDDFRQFADRSPYRSFMQTPEIATYREQNGWTVYYFAVEQNQTIIAASMVLAKPLFLGKSLFIAPGGPLMDLENSKLVQFFFTKLKKYAKTHNGFALQISPYYELIERDRDGGIIPDGFNRQKARNNLERCGFHLSSHISQPRYLFALDINHQSPDELFANFKRNTRNHIRKAEKKGVVVRELAKSELSIFKTITESTSERRNFSDRTLDYYKQMYDLFHQRNEIKYVIAEAEIDGKTIPLSVAMFMLYGDEIVYLFSGSDQKYMRDYNAQYLIQWYMIKYASEHDFARYNFYGIQGLPDRNSKDYGIYDFKKGFGGRVIELIGTNEMSLGLAYRVHEFLSRIKHHRIR